MNVKELREFIKDLPDDMEIILQKDGEGNGYSPLACADIDCVYIPNTTYSGAVMSMDWSADEACMTEKEWKKMKKKPRALVLAPVN